MDTPQDYRQTAWSINTHTMASICSRPQEILTQRTTWSHDTDPLQRGGEGKLTRLIHVRTSMLVTNRQPRPAALIPPQPSKVSAPKYLLLTYHKCTHQKEASDLLYAFSLRWAVHTIPALFIAPKAQDITTLNNYESQTHTVHPYHRITHYPQI